MTEWAITFCVCLGRLRSRFSPRVNRSDWLRWLREADLRAEIELFRRHFDGAVSKWRDAEARRDLQVAEAYELRRRIRRLLRRQKGGGGTRG